MSNATAAQISYIRKLQADKAYRAAETWDWTIAIDARLRSARMGIQSRVSRHGKPATTAAGVIYATEYDLAYQANRDAGMDSYDAGDIWEAAATEAIRADIETFRAAVTTDPETLTTAQASALIDTLKAW